MINSHLALLMFVGIDPNTQLKSNWTALMFAADSGRPEVVELLLNHSANPNSQCGNVCVVVVVVVYIVRTML